MILPSTGARVRLPVTGARPNDDLTTVLSERCAGFRSELADVRRMLNDAVLQLQQGFQGMAQQIGARDKLLEELLAYVAPGDDPGRAGDRKLGVEAFAAEATEVLASFAQRSTAGARDTLERLHAVSGMLGNLSTVVSGIEQLSTQTRFLSLNAAIEAARAGDRHPAFAAIAQQVERLSGETAQLNKEIGDGIGRTRDELRHVTETAAKVSSDFEQNAGRHVQTLQARADELRSFLSGRADAAAELREQVAMSITALQLDDVVGQKLKKLEDFTLEVEAALEAVSASVAGAYAGEPTAAAAGAIARLRRGAAAEPPAATRAPIDFRAGTVELF